MTFFQGDTQILRVEETDTESGILMTLKGSVTSESAYYIQDELDAFIALGIQVTIDFSQADFVAPSVLNALLDSQLLIDFFRRGRLLLRGVSDALYQEMVEANIQDLLLIEE